MAAPQWSVVSHVICSLALTFMYNGAVELEHSWGSSPTIPSPLAFLTEPSIPYTGYDEYSQPVVAQEYCADSVLAVNYVPYRYPSPVSNRGDQCECKR
ncbi:hypothetical protein HYPSUDRAFT_48062 [Hypholoma sublateritium FD-334 SS-4]|uniref:Uncharacterized protein n=1 Tax=Hypholoma sublateritium (strain FD-334 SS-4) TaxID=945553 RepID=A0A0D2NGG7_HYPSF|nr:hypothetical protein HYPSUDRAFT_48062 [Hypholoma sublateritium FD-334 SS-4]